MRWRLCAALSSAWLLAGCTLSAPVADATLAQAGAGATADLDLLAQGAMAAAAARPEDAAAQVEAARRLFQAADLRLQLAVGQWLTAHPGARRAEVLVADDEVGDEVRREVVSLCQRGLDHADRAAAVDGRDVGARLHQALHLSLLAWANGPARSLFAGYGPKLVRAIDAALALDPEHDGGAPLRLQGRFRGKAPWPYGDLALARSSLERATALAPLPVNHLFLGDVLAAAGEPALAAAQWRAAVAAPADESTRWSAELLRQQARARLAAPVD